MTEIEEDLPLFNQTYYGIIDKINGDECEARIYDYETDELADVITFNKSEFPKADQEILTEFLVFIWAVGKDENGCYSRFNLKRRSID